MTRKQKNNLWLIVATIMIALWMLAVSERTSPEKKEFEPILNHSEIKDTI